MKKIAYAFLLIICSFGPLHLSAAAAFTSNISAIPTHIQKRMQQYTWHQGCPLPLDELRYVTLTYWGFDKKSHRGSLIINKDLAEEVVRIFNALYQHHYPIERMELMDNFKGDDTAAMTANNTSSFNCRERTGHPGEFSQHSYGRAIDINTKINPYVKGRLVLPATSAVFADRNKAYPGIIKNNSLIAKLFIEHGWDWAGNWYDVQDYQHFEKRAKGEKRNPYG